MPDCAAPPPPPPPPPGPPAAAAAALSADACGVAEHGEALRAEEGGGEPRGRAGGAAAGAAGGRPEAMALLDERRARIRDAVTPAAERTALVAEQLAAARVQMAAAEEEMDFSSAIELREMIAELEENTDRPRPGASA